VTKVALGHQQSDTHEHDSDQEDLDVIDEVQKDDVLEYPSHKDTRMKKEKHSATRFHGSKAEQCVDSIYIEQGSPYCHMD
jgi:hypothetical protein